MAEFTAVIRTHYCEVTVETNEGQVSVGVFDSDSESVGTSRLSMTIEDAESLIAALRAAMEVAKDPVLREYREERSRLYWAWQHAVYLGSAPREAAIAARTERDSLRYGTKEKKQELEDKFWETQRAWQAASLAESEARKKYYDFCNNKPKSKHAGV